MLPALVPRYRVVVSDVDGHLPVDSGMEKIEGLFPSDPVGGMFDVVVMNHILEHVFSPAEFLESAHKALKEDGVLLVEVPFELYTPLVARHLGDWRHVAYFCRATLRQYLEKAGFTVKRLVLEEGCYGTRRLPVIRAIARKSTRPCSGPLLGIPPSRWRRTCFHLPCWPRCSGA